MQLWTSCDHATILRRELLGASTGFIAALAVPALAGTALAQQTPAPSQALPAATLDGFTHQTADLGEVQLHYVTGGQGRPVVLLHGWPQTWYAWHKIMPVLAEHFTVIAPDLRGLGDSTRPEGGYDKRTIAEDIHHLVSQLGVGPVSLVGHDWGAPVAYAYAASYPDDVQRLAMLAVGIPDESLLTVPLGPLLNGTGLWHFVFHAVRDVPEMLVAGRERAYLDWFYHWGAFDYASAFEPSEVDEYARAYALPEAMHAGFEFYRAVPRDIDDNRRFAQVKLKTPTLFVAGDAGGGLDDTVSQLKAVIEDVRGVAIAQCGHWIATERPQELLAQLLPFLSSAS